MKVRVFPPTSLSPGAHKLTAQERLKEIIDEHGLQATLEGLRDETCRRCLENPSTEAKICFSILRCVLEDFEYRKIEEDLIKRGY